MVYYKVVKDQGNGSNLFLSYINAKALIQERNKLLPELISSFGFLCPLKKTAPLDELFTRVLPSKRSKTNGIRNIALNTSDFLFC